MTKKTVVVVWAAALSGAAFSFTWIPSPSVNGSVNGRLGEVAPSTSSGLSSRLQFPAMDAAASQNPAEVVPPAVLQLEATVIVGEPPPPRPKERTARESGRPLQEMTCSSWRALDQGSVEQRVRVCE